MSNQLASLDMDSPEGQATARELRCPWGFGDSVKLRAYRNAGCVSAPTLAFPKHIFTLRGSSDPEPVRKSMKMVIANSKLRGYCAFHGNTLALNLPLEHLLPPYGPFEESGGITYELTPGTVLWRSSQAHWVGSLNKWTVCPTLVTYEAVHWPDQMATLVHETKLPLMGKVRTVEQIPLAKLMEDYSPNAFLRGQYSRAVRLATMEEPENILVECQVSPPRHPWAFGIGTWCKIWLQWTALLKLVRHKMYEPGSVGFKRARDDFEGYQEAQAAEAEAKMCDELQADADSLLREGDWVSVALQVMRTSHNIEADRPNDSDRVVEAMAAASTAPLQKRLDAPYYAALSAHVEHRRKKLRLVAVM